MTAELALKEPLNPVINEEHNLIDRISSGLDELPRPLIPHLTERKYELALLGANIGVRGPVLQNPLGGADVTGFLLSDDITDVFLQGKDKVGSPRAINRYLETESGKMGFGVWDSVPNLQNIGDRYGVTGLLIARIVHVLDGEITGLYLTRYVPRMSDKKYPLVTIACDKTMEPILGLYNPSQGILVTFTSNGKERRAWYNTTVSLRLGEDHGGIQQYVRFTSGLVYDTLLVKGAHRLDQFDPNVIYKTILEPTRSNQAKVVADSRQIGLNAPRIFWKKGGYKQVGTVHGFGYASSVYHGEHTDLVSFAEFGKRCDAKRKQQKRY